ncbi:hypothetical protein [Aquimarina macrocephali]|uniref:hypothetical protein n=1 Tax=Aquimarina macrocephali TaxID=666563 RepID=UPI003F66D88A
MIKVEKIFREVFDTIPKYNIETGNQTDKLFYHLGDQDELSNVLQTRQSNGQKAYPLLWYKLPNDLFEGETRVSGDFEFILAMNTQLDWFNDQRFNFVYNNYLYPNLQLVIQAFKGANNIQLNKIDNNNNFYRRTNYPNYGKFVTGAEIPNDYWDALLLKVNLTLTDNCMGEIKYNTKNII